MDEKLEWKVTQQPNGLINFKSKIGQINCKSFDGKGDFMHLLGDEIIIAHLNHTENDFIVSEGIILPED